jgi:hypothetical protein
MRHLRTNLTHQTDNTLNTPVPERPFNPLYDGRIETYGAPKFNLLFLIPLMVLGFLMYKKYQDTSMEKPVIKPQRDTTVYNSRSIYNKKGELIGEIGTMSDPHLYWDSVNTPHAYTTVSVKKGGNYATNNLKNKGRRQSFRSNKNSKKAYLNDYDSLSNNLVFAGSFEEKDNAERQLNRLKTIGYDKAEIVMKEKLPYKVVVTGFYNYKSSARAEVRALQKRGIDGYAQNKNLNEIYRNKEK